MEFKDSHVPVVSVSAPLFLSVSSAATFVVNVTQSSYQAEENHNVTLEWTFTTTPGTSWTHLFIRCELTTDHRASVLYQVHEGVEVSESQDQQFAGRVQSDKDVLREGRLRLHVSRLRPEDSGLYLCEVKTDYGSSVQNCRLSVSAADQLHTRRPLTPEPGNHTWIYLFIGLILTPAAVSLVLKLKKSYYRKKKGQQSYRNSRLNQRIRT
ncbi:uncharacterized protein [Nothobranchius furzeri]|uniref:uncharacterized protein isoform X2 n=1 Tax=Nothobranchius furzeri TaxID=105023 RepID=UPI003904CF78